MKLGQSELLLHRITPAVARHALGAWQAVPRFVAEAQHTAAPPHEAAFEQANENPASQVVPAAMQVAVGAPFTRCTQQVCMPPKHVDVPHGIRSGPGAPAAPLAPAAPVTGALPAAPVMGPLPAAPLAPAAPVMGPLPAAPVIGPLPAAPLTPAVPIAPAAPEPAAPLVAGVPAAPLLVAPAAPEPAAPLVARVPAVPVLLEPAAPVSAGRSPEGARSSSERPHATAESPAKKPTQTTHCKRGRQRMFEPRRTRVLDFAAKANHAPRSGQRVSR
jgi:hypothetical protein